MLDRYNRTITYLRISVTDRCNFRCTYCMPAEGIKLMPNSEILSFEEITEFTKLAVSMGVRKVRITGGEPLVRKDIIELIKMIGAIPGITDFALTTNGVYLTKYAQQLADAGLNRVNISMDTTNPEKFKQLSRVGNIEDVYKGVESAKKAGLLPIKINCVIKKSEQEEDAQQVTKYCQDNDLNIRYIRQMDLSKGTFWKVKGGDGGACGICNRLRLTANGLLRPCLFSDLEYDIRKLGNKRAIMLAVGNKPEYGTVNKVSGFSNIGG